VVILGSLSLLLDRYIYEEAYCTALKGLCRVLLVVLVVTRLLSGVHWLTDILAGVFLGGCLVSLFDYVLETIGE
jgi:undecaprenyl-diphosphatase